MAPRWIQNVLALEVAQAGQGDRGLTEACVI